MKHFFSNDMTHLTLKGVFGMAATGSGFYVSVMPEIEAWLRVISLLVGISVGVATLISIVRHKKGKRYKAQSEQ